MFVSRSMSRKVVTIYKDATVVEAREKLDKHHIRHLPVVEKDDILIGIVTDRDVRSAMPSVHLQSGNLNGDGNVLADIKVKDFMTIAPAVVTLSDTIQDALLLLQEKRVGALPVVDKQGRVKGILSVRDLMRTFIQVLGIGEPGTLVGVVVEEKVGQLKKVVDAITEEEISFGSVLVAKHWDKNKRAVFAYLLTLNISAVKRKLAKLGYELIDPMDWAIEQPSNSD